MTTGNAPQAEQPTPRSPTSNFINRIVLTTKFLFEINEQDPLGGGHTAVLRMFRPAPSLSPTVLRRVVLVDLLRTRGLGMTDAALAFGAWIKTNDLVPAGIDYGDDDIRRGCASHERSASSLPSAADRIERNIVQVAECYWEMHTSDIGRHSRVPEFFIPLVAVPQGRSRRAPLVKSHPEHVVPLAFIRDSCLDLLKARYPRGEQASKCAAIAELVPMVRKWLAVVHIAQDECDRLDKGPHALKNRMPADWDPEAGCLFARLHSFDIAFDMGAGTAKAWHCACARDYDDRMTTTAGRLLGTRVRMQLSLSG